MVLEPNTSISGDDCCFFDFCKLMVKVGTFSFGFDLILFIDSSVAGAFGTANLSTLSRMDLGRKIWRSQFF